MFAAVARQLTCDLKLRGHYLIYMELNSTPFKPYVPMFIGILWPIDDFANLLILLGVNTTSLATVVSI